MEDFLKFMVWKYRRLDAARRPRIVRAMSPSSMCRTRISRSSFCRRARVVLGLTCGVRTRLPCKYTGELQCLTNTDRCSPIASTLTGTLAPICKRRTVLTVSVNQKTFASCASSPRRASKKRCSRMPGTSSALMTRPSRLVVSAASRRKRSKRSSWCVSRPAYTPLHILTRPQCSILEADQEENGRSAA